MQRGATLPYKVLAGVEPCPGGWCVVSGKLQGITLFPQPPELFKTFIEILDYKPAFEAVALHIPVGLVHDASNGERRCDVLARKLLGWPRASAVQSPPVRAALDATTYEEAREANGGHLNPVTWGRMRWVREVAGEMQPYWQRMVYEVNPELAFHQLNDGVTLRFPKTSGVGLKERRE